MIAFIDDHRGAYGVEPICRVLKIAPSSYHTHAARRRRPDTAPPRVQRDAALRVEIRRVFDENFQVYGVRKVWRQLVREGEDVARCTVARLMRRMGLQGVIRGKRVKSKGHRPRLPVGPERKRKRPRCKNRGLRLRCDVATVTDSNARPKLDALQTRLQSRPAFCPLRRLSRISRRCSALSFGGLPNLTPRAFALRGLPKS